MTKDTAELRSLLIDRTHPLDLNRHIRAGAQVWRGPLDHEGNLGDEEQDRKSVRLCEIPIDWIRFQTGLRPGESISNGRIVVTRLKAAQYIRLDVAVLISLMENQHLIPDSWKETVRNRTRRIYFDGTIIYVPACRYHAIVPFMMFVNGYWHMDICSIDNIRDINNVSAVIT